MFTLPVLPFTLDALEPYIDKRTMEIHHGKHHQTYVDNLNKALSGFPELLALTIDELLSSVQKIPKEIQTAVRNNGGGHANHSLFWSLLAPGKQTPGEPLKDAINQRFGSFEGFQTEFTKAALGRFGSGWVWLIVTPKKELEIVSTANQDTPATDGTGYPVLTLDVWEHAYYLLYQNRRVEYVSAWWNVINWQEAGKRYASAMK